MAQLNAFDDDLDYVLTDISKINYETTSFPEPREFQQTAHDKLRNGALNGHRCQLIMAPTGAGKSYLGLRIIHEALKKGRKALFVCDRTTLIDQTSNVADSYGLSAHGIIQADHWRTDKKFRFQIASVQTLARRQWPEADVIVIDECFTGETLISTPDGERRIDSLNIGDCIYNSCGKSYIIHVFKNTVFSTVKIRLSNGTIINCTKNHPIFTSMGWRSASSLERGSRLLRLQDVQGLWGEVFPGNDKDRFSCGESRSGDFIQSKGMLREILRKEIEEPYAQQGNKGEGFEFVNCNGSQAAETWREWDRVNGCSEEDDVSFRERMGVRVCGKDTQKQQAGLSAPLQDRHCESSSRNCNRAGRKIPRSCKEEGTGSEENQSSAWPWVESIEVYEHRSGIDVFNLQVGTHPSYFANGVLVHNCHTQYSGWTNYIKDCKANVIGLSATPFSKGLGLLFSNLINAATMNDLTKNGVLVPMRVMSCTKINMEGAETRGGEWTDSAAAVRGMEIVGDVVSEWQTHAENRKTIVFGATINHCEEMARQFNQSGINAAVFSSETKPEERAELLKEYRKVDSSLRVLISVEALAKGFDVADVSCVCDVRPLRKSLSTAIQMWGRGLRSSKSTGKTDCLLLDFSGNIIRFREDFEDIYFNGLEALDAGEKLDTAVRKDDTEEKEPCKCPKCEAEPFFKKCMACGFERITPSLIEHVPGVMQEIMIGKQKAADNEQQLFGMICTYVRQQGNPDTQKQRAWHMFHSITGRNQPTNFIFDATPNTPISRAVMNKITADRIKWIKGQQKRSAIA